MQNSISSCATIEKQTLKCEAKGSAWHEIEIHSNLNHISITDGKIGNLLFFLI
jgi:hypothetical protein